MDGIRKINKRNNHKNSFVFYALFSLMYKILYLSLVLILEIDLQAFALQTGIKVEEIMIRIVSVAYLLEDVLYPDSCGP